MSTFQDSILSIVRSIPEGRVASYGQIGMYVGEPNASREVGASMHQLGDTPDFPWWRVLNNAGKISIPDKENSGPLLQQTLLEKEGIVFDAPLTLNMEEYRWRPDKDILAGFGLSGFAIESALDKFAQIEQVQDSLF